MRALFICPSLGPGGAERQWSILVPGLRKTGIDARVIALDAGGPFVEPLRSAGVPLEVLCMRHQADIRELARSSLVREFIPDVVVTRGVSGLYVGHALARWRGACHVYNEHRGFGLRLSRRREAMVRLIARQIDLVIAVSPDQAVSCLDRGFRPDRIVVVANGVQAPRVADSRADIRRELGTPDSAVVALMVASLRPEKRVPDFVRAVSRARERYPTLTGIIAGDGSDRPAVEAAAVGATGVRLLGHRDDVPRLLKAADIFVLASEHEAAPMAILEAMAAGLPVVATSVGGIPEIVAHGETGLLVAPGRPDEMADKLAELAADPELRRTMGRAGARRHRERWDAETMIQGYARILDDLETTSLSA